MGPGLFTGAMTLGILIQTSSAFREVQSSSFGQSYAKTLEIWHKDFINSIKSIRQLGFDHRLERLFKYYFSYCKAGFNSKKIDVVQKIIKSA